MKEKLKAYYRPFRDSVLIWRLVYKVILVYGIINTIISTFLPKISIWFMILTLVPTLLTTLGYVMSKKYQINSLPILKYSFMIMIYKIFNKNIDNIRKEQQFISISKTIDRCDRNQEQKVKYFLQQNHIYKKQDIDRLYQELCPKRRNHQSYIRPILTLFLPAVVPFAINERGILDSVKFQGVMAASMTNYYSSI